MCSRSTRRTGEVQQRALHVIDMENLLAGDITVQRLQVAWSWYLASSVVGPLDQLFAGFCSTWAPWAALTVPSRIRLVFGGHGNDSAETALMHSLPAAWAASRFEHAVVASADAAFVPWVNEVRSAGTRVTHVLGLSTRAAELRRVVDISLDLARGLALFPAA